ncbi:MAG TPA: hypothetical protein VMS86_00750, partial [Thermoanaerobaculia bacterium]|nr:hypothetical protein [Thermoanaerobaculia bacterium]
MTGLHHHARSDIRDWLHFIQAESHFLRERPALLFQQAANQPDGTAPALAAERRFRAGRESRPWLRWVNKAETRDPCRLTLAGHPLQVRRFAIAPDGRRVISAAKWSGGLGELKLWDAET